MANTVPQANNVLEKDMGKFEEKVTDPAKTAPTRKRSALDKLRAAGRISDKQAEKLEQDA
jgi:hypothetical protein